jgi:hypothetical protein
VIRVALAAALTVALLAASLPAVDDARTERTRARLAADVDRIQRAARDLASSDDATGVDTAGARRVVRIRLPASTWTSAPVAWVSVGGVPGGPARDVLAYRLADRPPRTVAVEGIAFRTPGGPVVLRGSGRQTVVLELVRVEGRPVVRVTAESSG